jgi:hypothetical protein
MYLTIILFNYNNYCVYLKFQYMQGYINGNFQRLKYDRRQLFNSKIFELNMLHIGNIMLPVFRGLTFFIDLS